MPRSHTDDLDDTILFHALNYGEMGVVADLLQSHRGLTMNENNPVPVQDRVVTGLLTRTAATLSLVRDGLPVMLQESGCTPNFREAVETFLSPVSTLIGELESDVIRFVRDEQNIMAMAADILDRRTANPGEWKLAAQFRAFVEGTNRDAHQGKEPKARAIELER